MPKQPIYRLPQLLDVELLVCTYLLVCLQGYGLTPEATAIWDQIVEARKEGIDLAEAAAAKRADVCVPGTEETAPSTLESAPSRGLLDIAFPINNLKYLDI